MGGRGNEGLIGGLGPSGVSGTLGRCGTYTIYAPFRLLSGVRRVGFHVAPGVLVGGRRVLSGTVAKFGRSPPRGPCS